MAAFIFGLILGNHGEFAKRLRLKTRFVVDERIKQFHAEISFVIRTFFFVFLGLVVTFRFGGGWPVSTDLPILSSFNQTFVLFLAGVVLIFLAIVAIRVLTARITAAVLHRPPKERRVLWSMMGRGLAAAVLASLPFSIPAFTGPATPGDAYYQGLMAPYEAQFLNIAFYVILLTVIVTTLGVATYARAPARVPPRERTVHDLGFMSQLDLEEFRALEEWIGIQGRATTRATETSRAPEDSHRRNKEPDRWEGEP